MPPRIFSWFFFYLFLALLIAGGIALFWPGRGLLIPFLTPKPENFTELFFENHLDLPKKVVVGMPYEFTFTIRNHEGKNVNYPVEVTAFVDEASDMTPLPSSSSAALVIYKGSVVVGNEQSKSVPLNFVIPDQFAQRVRMEVVLKNLNQRIFYRFVTAATSSSPLSTTASKSSAISSQSSLQIVQPLNNDDAQKNLPSTSSSVASPSSR